MMLPGLQDHYIISQDYGPSNISKIRIIKLKIFENYKFKFHLWVLSWLIKITLNLVLEFITSSRTKISHFWIVFIRLHFRILKFMAIKSKTILDAFIWDNTIQIFLGAESAQVVQSQLAKYFLSQRLLYRETLIKPQ